MVLRKQVQYQERIILDIFFAKIAKIPAIIEVMRPFVADESAFDAIVWLHSESMVHRYETIYDLLEHNAHIEHEFLFLMKLSMQIPSLQKDEYFLYIRNFIIQYERDMHTRFILFNAAVRSWNRFIHIKNMTGIGYILPGSVQSALV